MNHKVAVFYHCCLESRHRRIDIRHAVALIHEQMTTLQQCGLADAAHEIHISVNGDDSDIDVVRMVGPAKAQYHANGKQANSEIPSMNRIHAWAKSNPNWYVCVFHSKGLSHMEQPNTAWRLNMELWCLWRWENCVFDLDRGYDAVGCYWLTPEEHGPLVQKTPFFGGTFYWSKSNYIAQLPPLPEDTFDNRYVAEAWIGSRPQRPRVVSYVKGWPPNS